MKPSFHDFGYSSSSSCCGDASSADFSLDSWISSAGMAVVSTASLLSVTDGGALDF